MSQDFYAEAHRRHMLQCKKAYHQLNNMDSKFVEETPQPTTDEMQKRKRDHYLSHFDGTNSKKGIPAKLPIRFGTTDLKQLW